MSFEIIITKTETLEVESGSDWTVVGEELATPEAVPFSADDVDKFKLKKVYGFTPKIIKSEAVTTEIYRQTVLVLDLSAVIRTINEY